MNSIILAAELEIPVFWLEEANCHAVKAMLENPTWQRIMCSIFVQECSPGKTESSVTPTKGNYFCQQLEEAQKQIFTELTL